MGTALKIICALMLLGIAIRSLICDVLNIYWSSNNIDKK